MTPCLRLLPLLAAAHALAGPAAACPSCTPAGYPGFFLVNPVVGTAWMAGAAVVSWPFVAAAFGRRFALRRTLRARAVSFLPEVVFGLLVVIAMWPTLVLPGMALLAGLVAWVEWLYLCRGATARQSALVVGGVLARFAATFLAATVAARLTAPPVGPDGVPTHFPNSEPNGPLVEAAAAAAVLLFALSFRARPGEADATQPPPDAA